RLARRRNRLAATATPADPPPTTTMRSRLFPSRRGADPRLPAAAGPALAKERAIGFSFMNSIDKTSEAKNGAAIQSELTSRSSASTKAPKARAVALAIRPVGNTAQRSIIGKVHSASTLRTAPDASSGANIHSDVIARPTGATAGGAHA